MRVWKYPLQIIIENKAGGKWVPLILLYIEKLLKNNQDVAAVVAAADDEIVVAELWHRKYLSSLS